MAEPLALLQLGDLSLRLSHMSLPVAAGIYVALSLIVLMIGWRSLAWLGNGRRAMILGARLLVLYVLVMLLAGVEATQRSNDLSVMVLRDVSRSVRTASPDAEESVDHVVRASLAGKPQDDRIGMLSFDATPAIDALPRTALSTGARSAPAMQDGTDLASAIHLGLACFDGRSMKRMVLFSDGNTTTGDLDAALTAAAASGVPIDVVPVQYQIQNEVRLDRIVAPVWRREGEPFHLEVALRNEGAATVAGELTVTHQGLPVDLDANLPGVQSTLPATLRPGANVLRVSVPASKNSGVHRFRAVFTPHSGDTLSDNNAADAFTFVRGRGRVLYVDNYPHDTGRDLLEAVRAEGIGIDDADRIPPDRFPSDLAQLQSYDAVILGNVPRGPGGITDEQSKLLVSYVHDTGGGLIVTGGPDALGAGNWQGTEFAGVLPVDVQVPARRITRGGGLVLVIDHSGSMSGPMPGGITLKLQSAQQSALLALQTLLPADWVGVVAFDGSPDWVFPLQVKAQHSGQADAIRKLAPGGGTNIYPALDEATRALLKLTPDQVGVKHILLLTDGQSEPGNYDEVIARMNAGQITLSTIAIGPDADRNLLASLASKADGTAYFVSDPTQLTQVFVREARTVRRSLISEPDEGISLARTPAQVDMLAGVGLSDLPPLVGIVVTSRRADPNAHVPLVSADSHNDPVLAHWQRGLGKVSVFTSDPTKRWAPQWVKAPHYGKFWAQMIRGVSRPPMSGDFEVQMVRQGSRTKLIVDALGDEGSLSGLSIAGSAASPDALASSAPVRLVQTAPGRYETTIATEQAGVYVASLQYRKPTGERGTLLAGVSVTDSAERRDLRTDDLQLAEIARRTRGRVLAPLGTATLYDLFDRAGAQPAVAYLPLRWLLLPTLVGLVVFDVGVRRIQIDRDSLHRALVLPLALVRSFTATRKVESTQSLDALRRIRTEQSTKAEPRLKPAPPEPVLPNPEHKFEAQEQVAGDIATVVSGAVDKPLAPAPAKPRNPSGNTTSSLFEAKRRAQQRIREKEEGKE